MYELLIVACLIAQPVECEEFQIPFERPTGALACIRVAELRLAQWAESRPEWKIRKWTCGLPRA